jgi:hypothetical protein
VVDLPEDNEFVGKEPERPLRVAFGWIATGEFDEAGLLVTVEFAFVGSVGTAAMNRRDPVVGKPFAHALDGGNATVKRLADIFISPAVINLEQDSCPSDCLGSVFTARNKILKFVSLVLGQVNRVLFPRHR